MTRTESHKLKIEKRWLDRIIAGEKTSELRYNDRDFQKGDRVFMEWTAPYGRATDKDPGPLSAGITVTITHVLTEVPGLDEGYAVLSFKIGGEA